MKKYLGLEISHDDKIVGKKHFPIKDISDSLLDWFRQFSLCNVIKEEVPPKDGQITLFSSSKLLDILRIMNYSNKNGIVISERFKKELEGFNLADNSFYSTSILHKGIKYDNYSILRLFDTFNRAKIDNLIDFKDSTFIQKNLGVGSEIKILKIDSIDQYNSLRNNLREIFKSGGELYGIYPNEIFLKNTVELDLFTLGGKDNRIYISERLANHLKPLKLTGVVIYDFDIVNGTR